MPDTLKKRVGTSSRPPAEAAEQLNELTHSASPALEGAAVRVAGQGLEAVVAAV